ncbi:hypothetical protein, partial [Roseiconus lacunae]|uniref:hypothetical protein n=1 Tax=Roseiconus lacunae TaxID=2605694 RepID=UPI001E4F2708
MPRWTYQFGSDQSVDGRSLGDCYETIAKQANTSLWVKHLDNTFPLAGGSDEQTAGEGALSGPEGPTLPVGIGIYTSF